MSNSETTAHGDVHVRSKFGPIRIELLDDQLNRHKLGFGELHAQVPPGLYTLQYSAGMAHDEEIVRVESGRSVTREVNLSIPTVAPIGVSTTTHEFHAGPAEAFSRDLQKKFGVGGGLVIFVRTIDRDGRAPVRIEQLSLWNSDMQRIAELADAAVRADTNGFACLSAQVNPGGYALRWRMPESARHSKHGNDIVAADQSVWVSPGWSTIVFIGYRSETGQLERQSASVHMVRVGDGFQPGPKAWEIRDKPVGDWESKDARINQALDLALGGLRTGNQVVPDDLLDLLLQGKFQNPMLGLVGAHAILQRHSRDWKTFDLVVENLEQLIPGHPDLIALRWCGEFLRKRDIPKLGVKPLSWPPMLCSGNKALVECDWKESGRLIADGSVAERAAALFLPEFPWTCWSVLEMPIPERKIRPTIKLSGLSHFIGHRSLARVAGERSLSFGESKADPSQHLDDITELAVRRISHHIDNLRELGDDVDVTKLSRNDFGQLGLPVAAVEKAIQAIMDAADAEGESPEAFQILEAIDKGKQALVPTTQPQSLSVEVDDRNAIAQYANFLRVTGSPEELIIDLGLNPQPVGVPQGPLQIQLRIIVNYYTAKRLLAALQMIIQRHEAIFGVLETDINKRLHQPSVLK